MATPDYWLDQRYMAYKEENMTGKRSTESNIQSYHVGQSVTLTRGGWSVHGIVADLKPDSMGGHYRVMALSGHVHDATDSELSLN